MLVLFGTGEGGGIFIDSRGKLRRVSPWTADAMSVLKAVVAVLNARDRIGERGDRVRDLEAVAEKLSASIIPRLTENLGVSDDGHAVMFLDRDGGFVCGTTGRRPLPVPATTTVSSATALAAHASLAATGR